MLVGAGAELGIWQGLKRPGLVDLDNEVLEPRACGIRCGSPAEMTERTSLMVFLFASFSSVLGPLGSGRVCALTMTEFSMEQLYVSTVCVGFG